jgi:hypothetical protein
MFCNSENSLVDDGREHREATERTDKHSLPTDVWDGSAFVAPASTLRPNVTESRHFLCSLLCYSLVDDQ